MSTTFKTVPISVSGFQKLQDMLRTLKSERVQVAEAIADARKHGDLSENAEYKAAKERQAWIEGQIREFAGKIGRAEVIDITQLSGKQVRFGATVALFDEEADTEISYQILGEDEADIKQGILSINAPLARSLIGKAVGDTLEVSTPGGSRKSYEILAITYGQQDA